MDHQPQIGKIQAARRDVCGHADPRPAVAQGLEGVRPLALGHLARQAYGVETALSQGAVEVAHGLARAAEHQGAAGLEETQDIDHGVLELIGRDPHGAVFDIAVRLAPADRVDADGALLVLAGEGGDVLGDGGGEEQGAPFGRRGFEDELQVLLEAEIQHLVGLVQHHDFKGRKIEVAALEVIAQASGRADDHVRAGGQIALLPPGVHPADAGDHPSAGPGVEPGQFLGHLKRQLARGRHHQHHRRACLTQPGRGAEDRGGHGQPIGHGLARTGLGGDEQVAIVGMALEHGGLDGRRLLIALIDKGLGQGGMKGREGHLGSL